MSYYDSMTTLNYAIAKHDMNSFNLLLNENNINLRDDYGRTPLCIAVDKEYIDIIKILLSYKICDVNLSDCNNGSPIYRLLSHDQTNNDLIPIMELLINKGANVNTVASNSYSILYRACVNYTYGGCINREYNVKIINFLISNGANIQSSQSYIKEWVKGWYENRDAGIVADLKKYNCLIYHEIQLTIDKIWDKVRNILKTKTNMRCPECYGEKYFYKVVDDWTNTFTKTTIIKQDCEVCNGKGYIKEYDENFFVEHCRNLSWNERVNNSKLYKKVWETIRNEVN